MPDHTIAENLTRLTTARTNIATAITTKGGTVAEGAGFEDFPTAIGTIPSGDNSDLINLIERDITSIDIPSGTTSVGNHAFNTCTSLTSVTIPSTVTSIGNNAFYGCTSLTSVTIPNSVTTIGSRVFFGCTSLTSLTLSNNITEIAAYTCTNCTSLSSIEIPSNVTRINDSAFYNCSAVESVKFLGTTPPVLLTVSVFTLPTTCTIYVPTGSLTAYTTASNYPDPNTYTYVEY